MIRFKKDDGSNYPEWQDKKMKDVITLLRGSSPRPIVNYVTSDGSGVNWIKIGDMPKTGSLVTSVSEKITEEGAKKSRKVNIGDLILSNSMSFGKPYILGIEGYIHDGWFVIRDYEENFNRDYLCQLLASETVQHQYNSLSAGGVVQNISSDIVNSVKIKLPCLEEQQKIADFLSSVDDVITASEQEVAALEEQKKGAMQKIFSQEVRFKADDGLDYPEWEEEKMPDIAIINMGQSPDSDSYNEEQEGLPLVQGNADIANRITVPQKYTFAPTKVCDIGDIIMTVRAPVGYVARANVKACIGRGVCCIKNKGDIELDYIYYFLMFYENEWNKIAQGSTFTAISGKDINKLKVSVPCMEEQKKIANFLSDMDTAIDLAKQELEQWKELKKGLLQQLFE